MSRIESDRQSHDEAEPSGFSRRDLLSSGALLAGLAASGAGSAWPAAVAQEAGRPLDARAQEARRVRLDAADFEGRGVPARHKTNGDEGTLPSRIACFSKSLPHNALGEVDSVAYGLLLKALVSGKPKD